MLKLQLAYEDGRSACQAFALPLLIGRDPACDLALKSWRVARRHAHIAQRGGILFIEDLGSLGGTFVNGRRVSDYGPLSVSDEIIVGPCRMQVLAVPPTGVQEPGLPGGGFPPSQPAAALMTIPLSQQAARLEDVAQTNAAAGMAEEAERVRHRRRLHKALLDALDLRRRDIMALSDAALRSEATNVLSSLLESDTELPPGMDRGQILREVVDEAVGLGPLEPLLADRSVTEIMVNSHAEIYVERAGRLERDKRAFSSEQAVEAIIDRIVAPLGRRVDEASPMVDARLRDGSRVNAVIRPIALRGACLTIRKFPERRLDMSDLLNVGSLDQHMAAFLSTSIRLRKSVLVSGGTGSGKTTLLNVLSNCIPDGERIITIEDAAELRLNHEHLVSLESRPENAEGKGKVEIRDLVRNALRMRPDRIIVGECRGAEAFDMLSAMNTGHEGSLTTLHANSPRDALSRLETMILMAGMELPLAAIREHIAAAVDLIVQQARLSDGKRLVTAIVEITGIEAGRIQMQELFRYRDDGEKRFEGCGVQPECFQQEAELLPLEWLTQTTLIGARPAAEAWQF